MQDNLNAMKESILKDLNKILEERINQKLMESVSRAFNNNQNSEDQIFDLSNKDLQSEMIDILKHHSQ